MLTIKNVKMSQPKIDVFFKKQKNVIVPLNKIQKMTHESPKRRALFNDDEQRKKPKRDTTPVRNNPAINQSFSFPVTIPGLCQITPKKSPMKNSNSIPTLTPKKSPSKSPNSERSRFTPKKSNRSKKYNSPKKALNYSIDQEKTYQAIENLNFVLQNSINANEFDLEKIYATGEFTFTYGKIDLSTDKKHDIKDVVIPHEKHADHLFMLVVDVFNNVINCGYFNNEEIDIVFSMFTLSAGAQILLARMLKRKRSLQRVEKIIRLEEELKQFFPELVERLFLSSGINNEHILTLLDLLQLDEIKKLSKHFKVNLGGSKEKLINALMNIANNKKPLFLGAKTPAMQLREHVVAMLGTIVKIPNNIDSLFDRIFTLLIPASDPSETISDMFLMLTNVEKGEVIHPILPDKRYPIFRNRQHLLDYVESKNTFRKLLEASEKKDWEIVRNIGHEAHKKLQFFLHNPNLSDSKLPAHIQKYLPAYTWAKIVFSSVDAFKKSNETLSIAENYLSVLIQQRSFIQTSRGKWIAELALIKKKKNLDSSAALLLEGLKESSLTDVDVLTLLERVKSLAKLKNGISKDNKILLKEAINTVQINFQYEIFTTVTIYGSKMSNNDSVKKSTWRVVNGDDMHYMSVEQFAMKHYCESEYEYALHCEGLLPTTLFTLLFWDELYNINVPGAFVSVYQEAPLDLFTPNFFENRRKEIQKKTESLKNLDLETFVDWMTENFTKYKVYKTTVASNLFSSEEQFRSLIKCLGIHSTMDICNKLVHNYRLWRSGFPDLIVWNKSANKYKIVEIKGPNDTLSVKQTLWLQYLQSKGICAEVCHVKDKRKTILDVQE